MEVRLATDADIPAITALMMRAIAELQRPFLNADQIAASTASMGLDRQLIADCSYFVAEIDGVLAGCGGWGARATLYGGDHSAERDIRALDPAHDAARIRAMYTHPAFVRRGVGRAILAACEAAARAAGFARAELAGTLAGVPLYEACGYAVVERFEDRHGSAPVPLVRMAKQLAG